MQFVEVTNKKTARQFLDIVQPIYKNDNSFIRPLDKDIEKVFDPKQNKYFKYGEATRWILLNDNQQVVGRIAAFINNRQKDRTGLKVGGLGFFEAIDDEKVAFALFDHAIDWLKERDVEAVDGPINFGERNNWWGLLVDGFIEPVYQMTYNPPYYKAFFENYGFQTYFEQYSFGESLHTIRGKKWQDGFERIKKDKRFTFKYINKKNLEEEAKTFLTIYNKAWAGAHKDFKPMELRQARAIMKSLKPIMIDYMMWNAYFEGEPIGFFHQIPDINQIFKKFNGKFHLLNKLRFLWDMKRGKVNKTVGIVFGIVPEFQGKDVDAGMVMWADREMKRRGNFDNIELQWIGDFNPKMIAIAKGLDAKIIKTHITYRKIFDPSIPFERYPLVNIKKK